MLDVVFVQFSSLSMKCVDETSSSSHLSSFQATYHSVHRSETFNKISIMKSISFLKSKNEVKTYFAS